MPSLTIVSGPNEGDYYPLGNRTIVIGRDEGCPIQVLEPRASRKHVQIRQQEGKFIALDMGSTNGTQVNGRDLTTEIELVDGDVIGVGGTKLIFGTAEFDDRSVAFDHWKQRGERGQPTMME